MKISLSICLLLILIGCGTGSSLAHEGPTEIIQRLSHRIDSGGGRVEDYQRRAIEWRYLGKSDRAARDLHLALRRDPDYLPAWKELARVSLLLNDRTGAEAAARRALGLAEKSGNESSSTSAHLLLAEILLETGSAEPARKTIEAAFTLRPQQGVDAWWLRAEILAELDDQSARLDCLSRGWQQTSSEALRIAWIDTAIESGKGEMVLSQVEGSLERCRLKAAWRIRRARIAISQGRHPHAKSDLLLAMDELQGRLNPARPDRTVERSLENARLLLQAAAK